MNSSSCDHRLGMQSALLRGTCSLTCCRYRQDRPYSVAWRCKWSVGGTTIISQGDTDATKFYVLEKGTCDVLISSDATGNVPKKEHTYTSGR